MTSIISKHSAIIFENMWKTEVPEREKANTVSIFSKGNNFSRKEKNRTKYEFINMKSSGRTQGPQQPVWLEEDGFGARTS